MGDRTKGKQTDTFRLAIHLRMLYEKNLFNIYKMELSELEKQIILNHWSFLTEMILKPTNQGGSNATYFVHIPTTEFILKIYSTTTEASQIEYEHQLLSFLPRKNLSFAVPTPIPTSSGETLIHLETEQRSLKAALLLRLVGQSANRRNLQQINLSAVRWQSCIAP